MRKIVLTMSLACALLCGMVACRDKAPQTPMPNVVTYGSESVTVDSIAPDTALVIVEDTTTTIGGVTTSEPNEHKKHKPQGKSKRKSQGTNKTR